MSHLLIQADARRIPLADESVHCVVTSPPYFGLRDYDVAGQLGLEPTPDAYVAAMVAVFREVRRVLRSDGTAWVNMGDSYSSGGRTTQAEPAGDVGQPGMRNGHPCRPPVVDGLKPKDLLGIPWRFALALQADGWWLRCDVIWAKPNPMPESATDRPTKSHEYMFLLSKSEQYYYDGEAVKEKGSTNQPFGRLSRQKDVDGSFDGRGNRFDAYRDPEAGRNMRSVWSIPTEASPSTRGMHYATYPRKLVEPCVRAGTSEKGVCPKCGAPWTRVASRDEQPTAGYSSNYADNPIHRTKRNLGSRYQAQLEAHPIRTLGWQPGCTHGLDPVPATVFDPFIGLGTTIVVAEALGRRGIGIDLSRKYLGWARRRITRPHVRTPRPRQDGLEPLPLFDGLEVV